MPKRMLIAADLSTLGQSVITYGYSLAKRLAVEATAIHVIPHHTLFKGYEPWYPPDFDQEIRAISEKKLHYFLKKAEEQFAYPEPPKVDVLILDGDPGEAVLDYAKAHAIDLIVIGYKGQSALEHLIIGSTATKIARYAHCSVLIYRPGYEVL
jgi:nucleotide-binding universal stress UspA family protein